jgi:hypothetical protein
MELLESFLYIMYVHISIFLTVNIVSAGLKYKPHDGDAICAGRGHEH